MSGSQENIIQVAYIEHVRRRPRMYFKGTNSTALHYMAFMILENSTKQALQGKCNLITVTISDHATIIIEDNGPGVPVHFYKDTGKRVLELIFTQGGGRSFDETTGQFQGGMFGAGIASVNAASSQMTVEVRRDGSVWRQSFKKGIADGPIQTIGDLDLTEGTGTRITFSPDFEIFEKKEFNPVVFDRRLRELSYLLPQTRFIVKVAKIDSGFTESVYYSPRGILDLASAISREKLVLHDPIVIKFEKEIPVNPPHTLPGPIRAEILIQYKNDYTFCPFTYANSIKTKFGGEHFEATFDAFANWINRQAREQAKLDEVINLFSFRDISSGLILIINIYHPDPHFENWDYTRLVNPGLKDLFHDAVNLFLATFGEDHPEIVDAIIAKCFDNHSYFDLTK